MMMNERKINPVILKNFFNPYFPLYVIPAQAGIQFYLFIRNHGFLFSQE